MTMSELLYHFWDTPIVFVNGVFEMYTPRDWGEFPEMLNAKINDWFVRKDVIYVTLEDE